jgi:subfamily B ATP-binding cassette protein MsbA
MGFLWAGNSSSHCDNFLYLPDMKGILEIYRYTFTYKWRALLVILCNLLFVIFNLVSIVLFIPVLQLIFKPAQIVAEPIQPQWNGGFTGAFSYVSEYYDYYMQTLVKHDPKSALLFVCVTVFIAFFLKNLFRYGAIWHQSELRMAVVRDIRAKLFEKAMRMPLSFFTNERKGDLMSRMNSDVGEIEVGVISVLELIFREPIAILINIITLIYLSPQLTLASLILLPVSAFVISRIGKSLKRTAKKGQEQMGILYSTIDESLGGIRVIKAFNAAEQVYDAFKKINLHHQQLITKAFRKRDLSPVLNETLGAGVMLVLLWFGGSMILDGQNSGTLTGEKFLTFIIVFSQLLRPIQGISTSLANLNKARPSQDRINEILQADIKIREVDDPKELTGLKEGIRYEHVTFRYGEKDVLKDVSFFLPKGKKLALVGESGSGKSTLADLLPRFYDASEGVIYFDNTTITEVSLKALRDHIGIVSQESILFNATIKENIAFGVPDATDDMIERAARVANAHEFILQLENGYDTNVGERGNKLSGGQKQRISIARAILKDPDILILDEATSALDTESERLVQEALEQVLRDRTSVIIAHRLSTIRNADEIIVLSEGRIAERGSHEELMNKRGTYFNLCSLQGIKD